MHSCIEPLAMAKKFAIGFCESAVAFGEVGRDGHGGAIELVGEEAVASREGFGDCEDVVGEVD